jgi:hypothetical protein
MTDQEVLDELGTDSQLNAVRRCFRHWCGALEQAEQQREPLNPFDLRRLEFKAAKELIAIASRGAA